MFFATALATTFVVVSAFAAYYGPVGLAITRYEPQVGDVIFQSLPHNRLVNTIEGVTQSPYSHCGIVYRAPDGGWGVLEAFDGVEETSLLEFLLRGRGHGFSVYRLKGADESRRREIVGAAWSHLGKPYDVRYRMDDENIYCSELIYKAYSDATNGESLGRLVRLEDLTWEPFREAIRYFEKGPVPLEREMITPQELARARQLECVHSYNIHVE